MAEQKEVIHRKAAGLQTSANRALTPEGSMWTARNATIDSQGVISSRRGLRLLAQLSEPGSASFEYLKKLLVLDGTTLKYDLLGDGVLEAWTGNYTPPAGHKMRGDEVDGRFLFTTERGPYIQDSPTSSPRRAGIPQGLDITLSSEGDGLGGFLLPDSQVSYRVVFGKDKLPPGAPSFQEVIANLKTDVSIRHSGMTVIVDQVGHGFQNGDTIQIYDLEEPTFIEGPHVITVASPDVYTYFVTADPATATTTGKAGKALKVRLRTPIPEEVQAGWWIEIYRSYLAIPASTWPGDMHYKVTKYVLKDSDIANGYVEYLDTKDEGFLTDEAYTNPGTREGIRGANDRPPWCQVIRTWRGHTWFAGNVRREHKLDLTLQDVAGILLGDSLTLVSENSSWTFTAGAEEDVGTKTFKLWTTEFLQSVNVRKTAKSLVHVINADPDGIVYAHYVWDPVGVIRLVRRDLLDIHFHFTSSRAGFGEIWSPALPVSGDSVVSDADKKAHVVARSKFQKPESVPLTANMEVGKLGQEVLGLQELTENLLVPCYSGIHEITGETDGGFGDSFLVKEVDRTLRLLNPDCLCSLDTVAFGWFDGGICRVSRAGSLIVSTPVDIDFKRFTKFSAFDAAHFVPYESEHKLFVWCPESTASNMADVVWVYDYLGNNWMGPWTIPANSAIVIEDLLFLVRADVPRVSKERKSFTNEDFIDEDSDATITAVGTALTWDERVVTTAVVTAATVDRGWLISQDIFRSTVGSVIDNLDGTFDLTFRDTVRLVAGPAKLNPGIDVGLEWVDEDFGDSSVVKQVHQATLAFANNDARHHEFAVASNGRGKPDWSDELITPRAPGGWGYNWGNDWGGSSQRVSTRIMIPVHQDHQRCETLRPYYRHREALEPVNLLLLSLWFTPYSSKVTREGMR